MSKVTQEQKRETERAWYGSQVLRLAGNGTLPIEDQGKAVLVDALMRETADRAHAERAITAALDAGAPANLQGRWSLAELRNFIGATKQKTPEAYNPECPKCRGTGWQQVFQLRTYTHAGVQKEWLTEAQYRELCGKRLDPRQQKVAEAVMACQAGCLPRAAGYHAEVLR